MSMTLELFPNEIFIECFEYLNAFEIFYSFDQLNNRFSRLIRTIPLHLNFQYVRKGIFDQFCRIIQSNPELKTHIYSLQLSNQYTCRQMELFLSHFSLDQFSHLRSLTLIQIEQNNIEQFKSTLPQMKELYSVRFFDCKNDLLNILPMTNLRILSIPTLPSVLLQTSIITHLSVTGCSLDQLLYSLFEHVPLLKYLNIENIYKTSAQLRSNSHPAIHLKQLIIKNFEYLFEEFALLIQLTPNLRRLTLSALDNICMINADQWEYLIRSSLPYLKLFQFTFGLYCYDRIRDRISEKFQQFETDFWCREHRWFIEYIFDTHSAVIYTIPYLSDTYRLTLSTRKYSNISHTFDNVRDLTLCHEVMGEKCGEYFSHVISLTLKMNMKQDHKRILGIEYIEILKMRMNFDYLKHLNISSYSTIETLFLVEICQLALQLSSIKINPTILSGLFDDYQLCEYLKTRIKKLNIHQYGQNSFRDSREIEQFCEIFSSMEELICGIDQLDPLLILLNHSSNLSTMTVFLTSSDDLKGLSIWFTNAALKFNLTYRINCFHSNANGAGELYETELCIWTGGKY